MVVFSGMRDHVRASYMYHRHDVCDQPQVRTTMTLLAGVKRGSFRGEECHQRDACARTDDLQTARRTYVLGPVL